MSLSIWRLKSGTANKCASWLLIASFRRIGIAPQWMQPPSSNKGRNGSWVGPMQRRVSSSTWCCRPSPPPTRRVKRRNPSLRNPGRTSTSGSLKDVPPTGVNNLHLEWEWVHILFSLLSHMVTPRPPSVNQDTVTSVTRGDTLRKKCFAKKAALKGSTKS